LKSGASEELLSTTPLRTQTAIKLTMSIKSLFILPEATIEFNAFEIIQHFRAPPPLPGLMPNGLIVRTDCQDAPIRQPKTWDLLP
jgi:hypothetical protein